MKRRAVDDDPEWTPPRECWNDKRYDNAPKKKKRSEALLETTHSDPEPTDTFLQIPPEYENKCFIVGQKEVTYRLLQQYFTLPIQTVALQLGMCTTMLKKACRLFGIQRWPQRKIQSLINAEQLLCSTLASKHFSSDQLDDRLEKLDNVRKKYLLVMKYPNLDLGFQPKDVYSLDPSYDTMYKQDFGSVVPPICTSPPYPLYPAAEELPAQEESHPAPQHPPKHVAIKEERLLNTMNCAALEQSQPPCDRYCSDSADQDDLCSTFVPESNSGNDYPTYDDFASECPSVDDTLMGDADLSFNLVFSPTNF